MLYSWKNIYYLNFWSILVTPNAFDMEELSFRLTRLTDFDEIVSLSKGIYKGHDYLPVEFHKWMRMENMAIMLVLSGKKMIGSRAAYIIDDGKTYIRRAGRVLPEFRKQGISPKLSDALDEYVRSSFPTVERMRFVSQYNKFSDSLRLKKFYSLKSCPMTSTKRSTVNPKHGLKNQLRLPLALKITFQMFCFLVVWSNNCFQTIFSCMIECPSSLAVQTLSILCKSLTVSHFAQRRTQPALRLNRSASAVSLKELNMFTGQLIFTPETWACTKSIWCSNSNLLANLSKVVSYSFHQ